MTIDERLPTPIPPYTPLSNVTPFTYRDGRTYLETLERLRRAINDVIENEDVQNDAINEAIQAQNQTISELLSDLIGYTIEVNDYTYTASMQDGSTFTAYTIAGVDREIQVLSDNVDIRIQDLSDYVDNEVTTVHEFVNGEVAQLHTYVDNQVSQLTDYVNTQTAQTRGSLSHLLPGSITHKFYGKIPYTVVKIFDNENHDIGSHFSHEFDSNIQAHTTYELAEFAERNGSNVVSNACAMAGSRGFTGLVISDGIVHTNWEPEGPFGVEAIALMNDGTFTTYQKSGGHTGESMVADGVREAYGFGPLVLIDNVVRTFNNAAYWGQFQTLNSARTIHGYDNQNNFYIISIGGKSGADFGVGGSAMGQIAQQAGCTNAIVLDGGGSTQLYANSQYQRMSSDRGGHRPRQDAITISDVITPESGDKWQNITYINGAAELYEDATSQVKMIGDQYYFRGTVDLTGTSLEMNDQLQIAELPPNIPAPYYVQEAAGMGGNATQLARIRLSAPVQGIFVSTPQADTMLNVPGRMDISPLSGKSV